ncbi:transporter substrate-binding protein [Ruegeria arenilitoris]|uniref:transporter substrate-binding protein n=1 Tax=Ruegeria arenilitoris TaxID=1173585 RepID=UPI00147F428B|nr:transporter substrate-binding protein [Ruegeria arenilitoris]
MKSNITRRSLLGQAAAIGAMSTIPNMSLAAASDKIRVGGLHDLSGFLDFLGVPMNKMLMLAIEEVNDAGGLLGKELEPVIYDPQTNMSLYSQFATQLSLKDRAAVAIGGITSASRETIRPILHRYNVPYFYNTLYEGGVCDRNTVALGTTPAQTVEKLVPYTMKLWGKKVYTLAADYNYGHITAAWVKRFVEENGGEVVETDYFPLDVTNFGPTISKIQGAKPDMIMSVLVGSGHLGFYNQWAAAGMKNEIPIASTTFGGGGAEIEIIKPEVANGIVSCYGYYPSIDTPTNQALVEKVKARYPEETPLLTELSVLTYESLLIWADAVREAGSLDQPEILKVLEAGKTYDLPSGQVTIDPLTHHAVRDVYIADLQDKSFIIKEKFSQVQPSDTQLVCNLQEDPNANVQHEISLN